MESGEEVKRYSSFASFSSQNNTFEQELVEMEYQFDFDPSLSKDGPASAALKASRKRPRSSQSPPDQHQSPSFRSSKMQLDSDSEDEVPLSRSPTPPKRSFLPNPNAYSSSNPAGSKRSEYSKASLDTPLSVDNLGYAMLMKMGWNGQQGLGKDGKGRLAPVEMKESGGSEGRGLGKLNQDVAHILESTSARRELQSEKQSREGQEEKLEREKAAAAKATLKAEVNHILLTYKCELCNKQYSKTSELEEHLNSYDHHHKKRLKELAETSRAQARARAGPNAAEKRREKERKKEEEALRKASLAAGVVLQPSTAVICDISKSSSSSTIGGTGGFKPITNPSGGGGWKSVGSSSNTPSTSSTTSSGGGWNSTFSSSTTQSIAPNAKESLSSFFGKGHTVNLDTSSSSPNPPSISGFKPISSGFKSVSSATQGFNGFRPLSAPPPPPFDNLPPPPPPDDLPPPPPPPPM